LSWNLRRHRSFEPDKAERFKIRPRDIEEKSRMIRANYVAALAAAAAVFGFTASANAGPASSQAAGGFSMSSALAQEVDYRGGRHHCHWRNGYKRCHGERYGRKWDGPRYGYRPGITLRFGSSRDYDRRRRWR
jgi:hypothetical protein